jgi:hypothetical protein
VRWGTEKGAELYKYEGESIKVYSDDCIYKPSYDVPIACPVAQIFYSFNTL